MRCVNWVLYNFRSEKHDQIEPNIEYNTNWNRKHCKMGMEHRNATGCATKGE